jgi:hypothetical protein
MSNHHEHAIQIMVNALHFRHTGLIQPETGRCSIPEKIHKHLTGYIERRHESCEFEDGTVLEADMGYLNWEGYELLYQLGYVHEFAQRYTAPVQLGLFEEIA